MNSALKIHIFPLPKRQNRLFSNAFQNDRYNHWIVPAKGIQWEIAAFWHVSNVVNWNKTTKLGSEQQQGLKSFKK